jgi:hypothetical protein
MLAEGTRDSLHGFDPGSHGLAAPLVEELAGPRRRVVVPELLKGFLEKVSADGFEIVAEEIAQPEVLLVAEVATAPEQQPAVLLENRVAALAFQAAGFLGAGPGRGLYSYWRRCENTSSHKYFPPPNQPRNRALPWVSVRQIHRRAIQKGRLSGKVARKPYREPAQAQSVPRGRKQGARDRSR